jgi:hypothetical protein
VYAPPRVTVAAGAVVGRLMRDALVTERELTGLMQEALVSREPPRGRRSFESWLARVGPALGREYASEYQRNWRT